jgi:hypothetical protein
LAVSIRLKVSYLIDTLGISRFSNAEDFKASVVKGCTHVQRDRMGGSLFLFVSPFLRSQIRRMTRPSDTAQEPEDE